MQVSSDVNNGADRVPPQEIPEDEDVPSEKQKALNKVHHKVKLLISQIFQIEETGDIFLFNKRNDKVSTSVILIAKTFTP